MSRQPTARAGKKLGRYRIERELGRGGMGVVYLAEDENTGRLIALKTTSVAGLGGAEKSRNQRRQRFVREVKALTQVNHHNVVHVIDAGEADDPDLGWLLFYSMEYVEGETLAQLVQRRGALDPGAAAAVLMQVAAGLGAAHKEHIVHRDVKPANIFISMDGRALIGDFGICKIEGQTQITRRDQLVGTPNYLAPEQILGDPVSPATDVFALGALFYVITMNRPLRSHVDAAALLASAQGNEPKERMLAERGIPEPLRKVIARCLERDPKKRWPDGTHLADALVDFATKIPSLRDETAQGHLNELSSTMDRSSPFASLPSAPTGDVMEVPQASGFANPNDVEAAALAMLNEVEQRDTGKRKIEKKPERLEKSERDEKPLPVAKTESTVMFNLRAMEEEQQKEKPLPVARTESTVVYKMRGAQDEAAERQQAARLDVTSMGLSNDDTPVGGMDTLSEEQEAPQDAVAQPAVRSFDAPAGKARRAPLNLPALPRPAWVGLSGVAGAVVGLVVVLALAPPSLSTAEPASAVGAPGQGQQANAPRKRPGLCGPEIDAKKANKELAARLFKEAKVQVADSKRIAAETLEQAINADPFDPALYFELGKMWAQSDRMADSTAAYECVCVVEPNGALCESLKDKI